MMNSPNINTAPAQHGGSLSWIASHYPQAPAPYIDLSTCINPYGYALSPTQNHWHYELPDTALMQSAYQTVADHCHVSERQVALASGMQSLMVALAAIRLKQFGISSIGIVSPTYAEHGIVWSNLGHRCTAYEEGGAYDVVIICNPNNPDGRTMTPEHLLQMAEQLAARNGWLIVDESFADLAPQQSLVGRHDSSIVLRSYGKFYGIAGMRVSAAIASESLIHNLRLLTGPWPISTASCHLLPSMLTDSEWAQTMRTRLHNEAHIWREILAEHFSFVGHTALFTLVETDQARDWFNRLASQGILVRRFDYNARWLRFGLPDTVHLERLRKALSL